MNIVHYHHIKQIKPYKRHKYIADHNKEHNKFKEKKKDIKDQHDKD